MSQSSDPPSVNKYLCMVDAHSRFTQTKSIADLDEAISWSKLSLSAIPTEYPEELRPICMTDQYSLFWERYIVFREPKDLDTAIAKCELAIAISPNGSQQQAMGLGSLGSFFAEKYQLTNNPQHLQLAIRNLEMAHAVPVTEVVYRSIILRNLATVLRLRAIESNGNMEDLQRAVSAAEESLRLLPVKHNDIPVVLDCLADALRSRYENSGEFGDLQRAIALQENAERLTPTDFEERPVIMSHLVIMLNLRFSVLQEPGDIDRALEKVEEALALTPSRHRWRAGFIALLGGILQSKYLYTHSPTYLYQAISSTEEAITTTKHGDPFRPQRLDDLAVLLQLRFEITQDMKDIDQSIMKAKEAVNTISPMSTKRPGCLNTLSQSLQKRYRQSGDARDLQSALDFQREALKSAGPRNIIQDVLLDRLTSLLLLFYEQQNRVEFLEEAFSVGNNALKCTLPGSLKRASILSTLSDCFSARGDKQGNLPDFGMAIEKQQAALDCTTYPPYMQANRLDGLAQKYFARYSRFGTTADLEKSISLIYKALVIETTNGFEQVGRLLNLAEYLRAKYVRFGVSENLNEAVLNFSKALHLSSTNSLERGEALIGLANATVLKYDMTGDPQDLQTAISYNRTALKISAISKIKDRQAVALNNLANYLEAQYSRTGALQYLQEAIVNLEQSLSLAMSPSPSRALSYNNLASLYQSMYVRGRRYSDLVKCVSLAKKSVDDIPSDHPSRPGLLSNYSNKLNGKFEYTRDVKILNEAIKVSEVAVTLIEDPRFASRSAKEYIFKNLGVQLLNLYEENSFLDDLDRALCNFQKALDLHNAGEWDKAKLFGWLGICFSKKLDRSIIDEDGKQIEENSQKALEAFSNAWKCKGSPAFDRITASARSVFALAYFSRWAEASSIADEAVQLCPQLLFELVERQDQEYQVSRISGLAAIDCALVIQANKTPLHALEMLEMSRGVIYGLALQLNTELSKISITQPDLVKKYWQLRTQIGSEDGATRITSSIIDGHVIEDHNSVSYDQIALRKQIKAANQLRETLNEIHSASGYHTLQQSLSLSDLIATASHGPIVIFNVIPLRSDALILTQDGVKFMRLTELLYVDVVEKAKILFGKILKKRNRLDLRKEKREEIGELLKWLWHVAIEPVFQKLNFEAKTREDDFSDLPSIWWIGVGIMGIFPFHAAGDYSQGTSMCTMSRAISSYTPTIKALLNVQQKPLTLFEKEAPKPGILIIAMDKTLGQPAISAELETSGISAAIGDSCSVTIMNRPSVPEVLDAFGSYDIVHCICHGISDRHSPSNSHLILRRDESDRNTGETGNLTVLEISKKISSQSQIAFLSACSTAENALTKMLDESIHIASGFQLAGFSHVIGTMWKAEDSACVAVAGDFYGSLFKKYERNVTGHQVVALALHKAVAKLRDKDPEDFLAWAPFIHLGA